MAKVIIIKKVDGLGRIVIPKEVREKFKIAQGQKLNISTRKKNIILGLDTEQDNGIPMKVDELGRILIPYQIREKMQFGKNQELNVYTNDFEIFLQKRLD